MSKSKLEYIWLDGYKPTQNMRSKTKVEDDFSGKLEDCPIWSFDGSSTRQAEGGSSDCLLKPVAIYPDPARKDGYLVMTEVLNADGTPHESNGRATIDDDDNDFWPDTVELDRGSDPLDAEDTPFNKYFGISTGFFYYGGLETDSKYDAEALELSLSGLMEVVTEELVIPFLLIPIYFYVFFSRRQRFERLRAEIAEAETSNVLIEIEVRVNELIEGRKIKTLHGLIMRNNIEEQENKIRSLANQEEE